MSVKLFIAEAIEMALPVSIHWDLTWRCDHKCVHCYLTDRQQPELSYEEAVRVLDELVEAGTLTILFSGGDPFLRPDAIDIMRAARARDFDVRINTHGNFIDDVLADALAEIGVSKVSISVYSDTPEPHDAVTLIPGSHEKSLAAARRLIERGVTVNFKTPVMVQNRDRYGYVGPMAEAMGAAWELDAHIVPDDQSDFGLCAIGTDLSDRVLAMMHEMERSRDQVVPVAALKDAPSSEPTCSAATAFGFISPDGRLFPCINWRDEIGSLREHSFQALWYESEAIKRQRTIRRASYLGDCDGCSFHGKCSYCPGLSHAEHGDPGRRSEYVCERTHLTMAAVEYMDRLVSNNLPLPVPDSPQAMALFSVPTFAERQHAARKAGMSRPADRLPIGLVQIAEPRPG